MLATNRSAIGRVSSPVVTGSAPGIAAATLGMTGEIGVLRPGARADAVVLSEDPAIVPPARLREIGVRGTFAGRVEWH